MVDLSFGSYRSLLKTTYREFSLISLLESAIDETFSGTLILCVPPTNTPEALRSVKWHPKDPDTLAVASDNKVYAIDLANTHALSKLPLAHADLHHLGQVFTVSSVCVL
jgi:hypothetical protein